MKIILAFKENVEPLQLKFLNWIFNRKDINRNVLLNAVQNKDKDIAELELRQNYSLISKAMLYTTM